jgi:hypothetical protein
MTEIGFAHPLHRALSAIQLNTGMFSYQAIGRSQLGQRDRGATTDCPAGQREMQTFKNDPHSAPKRNANARMTVSIIL